jgi:glycogen operon protein
VSPRFDVSRGHAEPFGASLVRDGVNFSVFSAHAKAVTIVIFEPGGDTPLARIALDPRVHRTGHVWHAFVRGVDPCVEYAFQMDGPKTRLHRFDPARLLLDPCARAISGGEEWGRPPTPRRSVLIDEEFDWGFDQPLNTPLAETVIYELHPRGFTRHPSSGVSAPGTYAGLVEKIPYLKRLGVTAVEMMPVTEFDETDVPRTNPLTGGRLLNFWGYQPLALFAPKLSYASDRTPGGALAEFKRLVLEMHRAGIEVILDIVVNHTGEGGPDGPTTSFRGLDNATYYMIDAETGRYRDYTGCGNTLNCNHPVVRDLIMECLRFWVTETHVDGFRFDLASVLGRGRDGQVLVDPPLLEGIAADPILAHTKLIAEAWDAAGLYQVGSFPAWGRWAEWNGRFRDDVRRFLRGDAGLASAMANRLAGSGDLYRQGRTAHHSVNFVTSHDGFTLVDLVSYNHKHNESNGEGNRDGVDVNDSWNCGVEGPDAPPAVLALRERQARNFMAVLFLSQGVPMLLAGDECGRTQQGNNNAYCHDTPLSWMPWDSTSAGEGLRRFVSKLVAFRRRHAVLRAANFLDPDANGRPAADWHGIEPFEPDWSDRSRLVVVRLFDREDGRDLLIAVNAEADAVTLHLPAATEGAWFRAIDTGLASPLDIVDEPDEGPSVGSTYRVSGRSVVVLVAGVRS